MSLVAVKQIVKISSRRSKVVLNMRRWFLEKKSISMYLEPVFSSNMTIPKKYLLLFKLEIPELIALHMFILLYKNKKITRITKIEKPWSAESYAPFF